MFKAEERMNIEIEEKEHKFEEAFQKLKDESVENETKDLKIKLIEAQKQAEEVGKELSCVEERK